MLIKSGLKIVKVKIMKMYLKPFTSHHKIGALKRLFKLFVFGTIKLSELKRTYLAILNLERYLERLKKI